MLDFRGTKINILLKMFVLLRGILLNGFRLKTKDEAIYTVSSYVFIF